MVQEGHAPPVVEGLAPHQLSSTREMSIRNQYFAPNPIMVSASEPAYPIRGNAPAYATDGYTSCVAYGRTDKPRILPVDEILYQASLGSTKELGRAIGAEAEELKPG